MERRKSTREFKLEAVKLIKERGVACAWASQNFGGNQTVPRNWVKKLAGDPLVAAHIRLIAAPICAKRQ